MDAVTARKILGVSENAPLSEIRKRYKHLSKYYHPDVPDTGDSEQFILINTAYLVLQADEFGIENKGQVANDIAMGTRLKVEIDYYFDNLLYEFKRKRAKTESETRQYIRTVLASVSSSEDIKKALKSRIEGHLTDTKVEIEAYVKRLVKNADSDNEDYVFNLFKEMYKNRRITWLRKLYKNPVFTTGILVQLLFFLLRFYPQLRALSHDLFEIVNNTWVSVFLGGIFLSILTFQYIILNPRRQFLPPKLSLSGLNKLIDEQISKVGGTHLEFGLGGGLIGGIIGSIFLPGIGTLIGTVVGSLFAFAGNSMGELRAEVENGIMHEFCTGMQQVENTLTEWIEHSKVDVHEAAIESFTENCHKIAGLISTKQVTVRLLDQGKKTDQKQKV